MTRQRRFPSPAEQRAVELGAAELITLVEWQFRNSPRALRNVRTKYRQFCVALYGCLKRARNADA
jgi:hypothetical protein